MQKNQANGRLQKKVAVITGGASGMGRATLLRFLQEGADVVFADLNQTNAEETLGLVGQLGLDTSKVRFIRTNVTAESDIEAMIQCAVETYGRLDILLNNAGVGGAFGPITEIDVEDWDMTQHILLRSVFLGIKHAGRVMQRQNGGCILSTASVAGLGGGAGPHAYSAAKAGVVNLTRTAATELAEWNIRVNALAPGLIVTPLTNLSGDMASRAPTMQPLQIAGDGNDIANLALFLASDEARFISGQTYVCDGGLLARGPSLWRRNPEDAEPAPLEGMKGMAFGSSGEQWRVTAIAKSTTLKDQENS